jgi:hypothetical protein
MRLHGHGGTLVKLKEPRAPRAKKPNTGKPPAQNWTTVKVSAATAAKARSIRKTLLKGGQQALPPALRKSVLIPEGLPSKLVDKKFGLGQIFQLGLDALAAGLRA